MKRTLLLLIPAALFGGCAELGFALFGVGTYESEPFRKKKTDEVWSALQEVVNHHFNIRHAFDDELRLETDWNEHLGPMYKMGRRLRVRAWVRHDDELGDPFIEIAVDREVNTNFESPLSRANADWSLDIDAGGRDQAREMAIVQGVRRMLYEITPSEQILNPKKSEYRKDKAEIEEERLWGPAGEKDKEKEKEKEKAKGPPADLWGGSKPAQGSGKNLWR